MAKSAAMYPNLQWAFPMEFMKNHSVQKNGQGKYESDYPDDGVQDVRVQRREAKFALREIAHQTQSRK